MDVYIDPASSEQSSPPPPSEWFNIWIKATTSPNEQTYQEIARRADLRTGLIWLSITYLVVFLIIMMLAVVATLLFAGDESFSDMEFSMAETIGGIAAGGCCGLLVYTGLGVGMTCLVTAISNAIARAFGGTGDFQQLLYCVAAYTVPTTIISMILGVFTPIPCVGTLIGLLSLALGIYTLVLNVIAIKAVHQIETWQAVVSGPGFLILLSSVAFCCSVGILLMEPDGGGVFSNVIEGLESIPGY